jgi:hypothetical protein
MFGLFREEREPFYYWPPIPTSSLVRSLSSERLHFITTAGVFCLSQQLADRVLWQRTRRLCTKKDKKIPPSNTLTHSCHR